ncbi:serine hydrolase [Kitasatospora sp. NPDC005748]|uniref:serine hydrolase n=1 Tax=Kitasatospora sp. NPDC005748 TaxID=3157063 RepID=UPI0033D40F04
MTRTTGLTNPPGVTRSYSTTAWNVFGRIVEVVTGGTWDEALRELLRAPLFGVRATAQSGRDA